VEVLETHHQVLAPMVVIVFLVLLPQLVAVAVADKETQVSLAAVEAVEAVVVMALLVARAQSVKGTPAEPVIKQVPIIVLVVAVGQVLLEPLRQQVKVETVEQELFLQLLVVR
jgi:hypothetical protein